jgi:phosphoribosylanthranilate isomerase
MTTRIKICGITNLMDALLAEELGAHALGFIFHAASPRAITVARAAAICRALPPFVARVGVFVNALEAEVVRAQRECGLTALQFHGEERPAYCRRFAVPVIKAIRVRDAGSLAVLRDYRVDALLLDTYSEGARGGTGKTFDWGLAVQAKHQAGKPVILSGGLNPDNVGDAIRQVRPYAIDVASGVERAPGKKDPAKLRALMAAVRGAE